MNRASVNINLDRVIGEAHDHLYGANLEHLGTSRLWRRLGRDATRSEIRRPRPYV